jgi:hypothetical protein
MADIRTPANSRRMANRWPALHPRLCHRKPQCVTSRQRDFNYTYAVLQSQVQIRLVAEGYDPMLGIMHSDRDDAGAFVFDMMESERPKVDRVSISADRLPRVQLDKNELVNLPSKKPLLTSHI